MIENKYRIVTPVRRDRFYVVSVISNGNRKEDFIVDATDINILKQHNWTITGKGLYKYVICTSCKVLLHRLLTGASDEYLVDHMNHSTLDNRKSNLRLVTHKQNMMNKKYKRAVKYPVAGISILKSGKVKAHTRDNGVRKHIGTYESVIDAMLARARWEYENYKEHTPRHRSWIKRVPFEYRMSWFPEVYGLYNDTFVLEEITKNYLQGKSHNDMLKSLERYRKEAREYYKKKSEDSNV